MCCKRLKRASSSISVLNDTPNTVSPEVAAINKKYDYTSISDHPACFHCEAMLPLCFNSFSTRFLLNGLHTSEGIWQHRETWSLSINHIKNVVEQKEKKRNASKSCGSVLSFTSFLS